MDAAEIIACSRCHCRHRAEDFGANRLGERWKTCVACRQRFVAYRQGLGDEHAERQRGRQAVYKAKVRADPVKYAAALEADKERRDNHPRCPHNIKAFCVRCPETRGAGLLRTGRARAQKALGKLPAGEYGRALGCDGPTIVAHIEAQLTDGLTWENYGERWQIDHTISLLCDPGAAGGLPSATEIRDRCHYTNLRPIAIADHRAKTLAERATRRALVVADAAHLELTDADIDAILIDVFG